MNIIAQTSGFIQVSKSSNFDIRQLSHPSSGSRKDVYYFQEIRHARLLISLNLNVFPLHYGTKIPYKWLYLTYTQLRPSKKELLEMIAGGVNLAVMCGHTSNNLFVIDCETEESFEQHLQAASSRNLPIFAIKTPRGGHLYFHCIDGEVENIRPGVIPNVEIRGRRGYVVAPPSRHPNGQRYVFHESTRYEIPYVTVKQIDWLRDKANNPVNLVAHHRAKKDTKSLRKLIQVLSHSNLSLKTRHYLDHGRDIPEGNRNNSLFAAACDLAGNNFSFADAERLLVYQAMGSGLTRPEIMNTIRSAYSRLRTPSRPSAIAKHRRDPKSQQVVIGDHEKWKHLLVYAVAHKWEGRRAMTYRAVFLALIERFRLAANAKGVFRASLREIATLARISVNTARKVLADFIHKDMGLLFQAGHDYASSASLWRFPDNLFRKARSILLNSPVPITINPEWSNFSELLATYDALERGGLGKAGGFLYELMRAKNITALPSKLSQISGLSLNQVNYALKKLREFNLVERTSNGWRALYSDWLYVNRLVLEVKGRLRGALQRRRLSFEKQRAKHAWKAIRRARIRVIGRLRYELAYEFMRHYAAEDDDIPDDLIHLLHDAKFVSNILDSKKEVVVQCDDGQVFYIRPIYWRHLLQVLVKAHEEQEKQRKLEEQEREQERLKMAENNKAEASVS